MDEGRRWNLVADEVGRIRSQAVHTLGEITHSISFYGNRYPFWDNRTLGIHGGMMEYDKERV